jgi:large subunit ribosomal protein L13
MIVDVKGLVAGRVASQIAKAVVKGEKVIVLNAQDAVIVGNPESTMEVYHERTHVKVHSNPHFGPKYERIPSKMFRRMVRGMLPNRPRASVKYTKMVTVYNGTPKLFPTGEIKSFEKFKNSERHRSMTLGEIAKALGGTW